MNILRQANAPAKPQRLASRPARWTVSALATGVLAGGALVAGAGAASAEPISLTDATFEWGINTEVQSTAFFGGCNYLSAGESDGTEAAYAVAAGDVSIVKDGGTPTWASKCGLTDGAVNQKVVWSGGTGSVDPATGEATIEFTGLLSANFYGGLVPFTFQDPVLTVDGSGDGQLVATMFGYESSMDNPDEKYPLDPVPGVVVADLSGVAVGADGFTFTPDYEGVEIDVQEGYGEQNRTVDGWGAWPQSFVDFQFATGLSSYWYSSGTGLDAKKPPTAITVSYDGSGGSDPDPDPGEPGEDEQLITVTVPEETEPGEFLWSIDAADRTVALSEAVNAGAYLQSTGEIKPIAVTDTRTGGPDWSISGQVSDFTGGLSGSYLGWTPSVIEAGAGAAAGESVASAIDGGNGLTDSSVLASATAGHESGTAKLGADLDLRLPVDTDAGTYTATLTVTALS
jgi:hypothetical protein